MASVGRAGDFEVIVRTEFSFRIAYGRIPQVFDRLPEGGVIADLCGTWGHIPFAKEAKKRGLPRGLGARVRIGTPQDWRELILVATSSRGLSDLYGVAGKAARGPIPPGAVGPGDWVGVLGADARGQPPAAPPWARVPFIPGAALKGAGAAFSDNRYPAPEDANAWAFSLGARGWRTGGPAHILLPEELVAEGAPPEALQANRELLARANEVPLPTAQNVKFPVEDAQGELAAMCRTELVRRGLDRLPEYKDRLERELALIVEKKFADYFLVIAEMLSWAKARMLCGPGRGSSAGSIVCWLLRITEVDPLKHKLLFERFVDTNRFDLPDVDVDLPDEGRGAVLEHLADKYGAQNVAHIGSLMVRKPRSALVDVAKELKIPPWELDSFKDVIIERSSGDSRVNDCLRDSMMSLESGRQLLAKYPELEIACELEGGVRQSGKHAAGMIVCNEPVEHFCTVGPGRVAQIDKKMAEVLNILKIDALGLRTLSVLQTAAEVAGMDREAFYSLPLEDAPTLAIFNRRLWAGIFQYEGHALQSIANQITFRSFEDIVALTALARPGPLGGGATTRWIEKHEGRMEPTPLHPMLEEMTRETYGEILYQETIMQLTRQIGNFSWADTAAIRRLMSNRQGDEAFGKFEVQFLVGAVSNGMTKEAAKRLWDAIHTFGSWSFNRSHAVVYGTLSWWCLRGNTVIYDWDNERYISIAKAFKEGVKGIACYDEQKGLTVRGEVEKIFLTTGPKNKDLKMGWRVNTKSHKMLQCSAEHKILTPAGYKMVKELKVGDLVASEKRIKISTAVSRQSGGVISFEPIKSIEQLRPMVMYDIAMKGEPHNFLANGIVVHNCAFMKAHWPQAFAAGCLRHAKDDESALQQLRELAREGVNYTPFDPAISREDWEVINGQLVGGLLGIRGIGRRKAAEILTCRDNGIPLKPGLEKLLKGHSVFEDAFPTRKRFSAIYANPHLPLPPSPVSPAPKELAFPQALKEIADIRPPEEVYVIGQLIRKGLRDWNEPKYVLKRGGELFTEKTKWLVLHLQDDTGRVIAIVDRHHYEALGAQIVEKAVIGSTWLMLRGMVNEQRFLNVRAVRWLATA